LTVSPGLATVFTPFAMGQIGAVIPLLGPLHQLEDFLQGKGFAG
jgi:hypothetical protein